MTTKIAAIGAGSFVFGPSVLAQTFLEYGLNDVHLALVDPDVETIELMAGVCRRMARERGLTATITTHADRAEALDGAGFVICSASPQMKARFQTDWRIIDEYAPGHLKTEFGGIAGIGYSLRQIALIRAVTDDMKRFCPQAWLLNVSNPLPRVAQAASENGIQTAGFCAVSLSSYGTLWRLLTGEHLAYPWEAARAKWRVTSAGLNHFAWVVGLEDRASGEDLLPLVRERLATGGTTGQARADALARETGSCCRPATTTRGTSCRPPGQTPARTWLLPRQRGRAQAAFGASSGSGGRPRTLGWIAGRGGLGEADGLRFGLVGRSSG